MEHDYKPGDVVVFKVDEDELLSVIIGYLTDSDVSHAALIYEDGNFVEMGPRGIAKTCANVYANAEVYHYRHSKQTDMAKVIKAAKHYLDKDVPYDYPSLVILAGLLIYHKQKYTPKYKTIVDFILGIACWSLDELLKKIGGKKNGAMMCSQLVYQCFRDAGHKYRLKIKNGVVFESDADDYAIRLIDLVNENEEMERLEAFQTPTYDVNDINQEDIIRQLHEELINEAELEDGNYLTDTELEGTAFVAGKFLDLLEKAFKKIGPHIPRPSLFITPADICHAQNLSLIEGRN